MFDDIFKIADPIDYVSPDGRVDAKEFYEDYPDLRVLDGRQIQRGHLDETAQAMNEFNREVLKGAAGTVSFAAPTVTTGAISIGLGTQIADLITGASFDEARADADRDAAIAFGFGKAAEFGLRYAGAPLYRYLKGLFSRSGKAMPTTTLRATSTRPGGQAVAVPAGPEGRAALTRPEGQAALPAPDVPPLALSRNAQPKPKGSVKPNALKAEHTEPTIADTSDIVVLPKTTSPSSAKTIDVLPAKQGNPVPRTSDAYFLSSLPETLTLDDVIKMNDPRILHWGKNVDKLLKYRPPNPVFEHGVRPSAYPTFDPKDVASWLDDVKFRFGEDVANSARDLLNHPSFGRYMYPKNYKELAAGYQADRELFEAIAEPYDTLLAGSPGIASEGTLFRDIADPHDLDFATYVGNASKKPFQDITVDEQVRNLTNPENLMATPAFQRLREKFPELRDAKVRIAKRDWEFDYGPNGDFSTEYRYAPDSITIPMAKPVVTDDGRVSMLATARINGKKVDFFLTDHELLPSKTDPRLGPASAALAAKRGYLKGKKPRPKDVSDLTGYHGYDSNNLLVNPYTGQSQFASMLFPETSYLTEQGLPRIVAMPIDPTNPDIKVPVVMNDRGEFLQLNRPRAALERYAPEHPMYRFPNDATSETHPLVTIRGTSAGRGSLNMDGSYDVEIPIGEVGGSDGIYSAKNPETLIDDLMTPRPGNWATNDVDLELPTYKTVVFSPRATIDPRYNSGNLLFDTDAFTFVGHKTPYGATHEYLKDEQRFWRLLLKSAPDRHAGAPSISPLNDGIFAYPEINSGFRHSIYESNPGSHYSGDPSFKRPYQGYGEGKSDGIQMFDDRVAIPGELIERNPKLARKLMIEIVKRLRYAAPVAAAGLANESQDESRETELDAKGGQSIRAAEKSQDDTAHKESTAPTDEQLQEAVEFLEMVMKIGAPQNQWEQQAVKRIHDVLVETLKNSQRTDTADQPAPRDEIVQP